MKKMIGLWAIAMVSVVPSPAQDLNRREFKEMEKQNDTSRLAFLMAVEKFINQGAVIVWNHPG